MAPLPEDINELRKMQAGDAARRLKEHTHWEAIHKLALAKYDITTVPELKKIYDASVKNPKPGLTGAREIRSAARDIIYAKAALAYMEYRQAGKDSGKMKAGQNRTVIEELKKARWNDQLTMLQATDGHVEYFFKHEYPKHQAAHAKAIVGLMPHLQQVIDAKAYYKPATSYRSRKNFEYRVLNDAVDAVTSPLRLSTEGEALYEKLNKIPDFGAGTLPGKIGYIYESAVQDYDGQTRHSPVEKINEAVALAPPPLPLRPMLPRKTLVRQV